MIGSIHLEATEKGTSIQTRMSPVNSFDRFQILCMVQRSLEISKEDFAFTNALIQSGLDKLFVPEQNTTEVSIPSEILAMIEKLKGDNHNEG